jgi:nucleoside-diphosphate-sugar epimerase
MMLISPMFDDSWVVIAGGAGFLGCHLARGLLGLGRKVICIDDVSTGRWENLDGLPGDRVLRLEHDVRTISSDTIRQTLPQSAIVSAVCNFASPASPPAYLLRPVDTLEIGSIGTQNLIKFALDHNARFLQASTSEIYGDPLEHPQTEQYWGNVNSIGPRSCYDEAKRYGEAICAAYERSRGLDLRMARIFNTYGPRMQADDGRVITNFIHQALTGEPITLYGTGTQTRSFCFVDDLIEGLILLLGSDVRGPVNLGNPVEFTMLELAQKIIEQTRSTSPAVFRELPIDDPTQRKPDIGKAQEHLGWAPKTALDEGLARTIEWFTT